MAFGDLTNLADVKAWLRTADSSFPTTDDVLLSQLITSASSWIQNQITRDIASNDYEELRDGTGSQEFVFANTPVTAVLLVAIPALNLVIPPVPTVVLMPSPASTPTPVTVSFSNPSFGAPGYLFTPTKLVIRGYWIPRAPLALLLQYTAGFATVPADLQQACKELVAARYRVERDHPGIVSTVMQPATTVSYSQKDCNAFVRATINKYSPVAPVSAQSRVLAPTATDPATIIAVL
jgi:hypothetical protein